MGNLPLGVQGWGCAQSLDIPLRLVMIHLPVEMRQ